MSKHSFVGLMALITSLSGCPCSAPKLNSFHVAPQAYCPNTKQIQLSWDADGEAYLQVSPPDSDFKSVDGKGSRPEPSRSMTATIKVLRHNREDGGAVTVAPLTPTRPFVGEAVDCDEHQFKTKPIPEKGFSPDVYDPSAHVTEISNGCNNSDPDDPCPTITVCHGLDATKNLCSGPGTSTWTVAPGSDLPVPATSMTGYWSLGRDLIAGEHCGPPAGSSSGSTARSKPASVKMSHLKVTLHMSCDQNGATP